MENLNWPLGQGVREGPQRWGRGGREEVLLSRGNGLCKGPGVGSAGGVQGLGDRGLPVAEADLFGGKGVGWAGRCHRCPGEETGIISGVSNQVLSYTVKKEKGDLPLTPHKKLVVLTFSFFLRQFADAQP